MRTKAKTARAPTNETKNSRAALWTIQLAVDAVTDGLRRLKTLQSQVDRSRRAALGTLQMARHHPLQDGDLLPVERSIGQLAKRLDRPESIRSRACYEHLQRPLRIDESCMIGNWAGSAFAITVGMLDISEQLDAWYTDLIVSAVAAARTASPQVTVETHKRRAAKLMQRLDRLCADERVAWAFAKPKADEQSIQFPRTLH